uniref:G_PROTEIN_RECEP_F1_2 domain-containing protein n=1 Tax=Rhabditophanes sp. KR3021 TaxID=114890 RepID=A0AC35UFB6_9BILA
MNSVHDKFMFIGGIVGCTLNLIVFILMNIYPTKNYDSFKFVLKYLRLFDGAGAFMLGVMGQGQFLPGLNFAVSHGVCQRMGSELCSKITYAACINITMIVIGGATFINLMRYNVFYRKAQLLTTSIYDKIIFTCVFIIAPISIFSTCYQFQVYKGKDILGFQLDPSELEDYKKFFTPEYTLYEIPINSELNAFSYAVIFTVLSILIIFSTGIYYYFCVEWSLKKARKEAQTHTATKITKVIYHLRFQNLCLIVFCFAPIITPMLLIVFNVPRILKPITSNCFIFINSYFTFASFFATYHFYKNELKKCLHDLIMLYGSILASILCFGSFLLMQFVPSKTQDPFKFLMKFQKLMESILPIFLGVMTQARYLAGYNGIVTSGLCRVFDSDWCSKISIVITLVVADLLIVIITATGLMRQVLKLN